MKTEFRKEAEPIAEDIIVKMKYHMRYKMGFFPKEEDVMELRREIKSILVQNMQESKNV